jgi:hypothetical protein
MSVGTTVGALIILLTSIVSPTGSITVQSSAKCSGAEDYVEEAQEIGNDVERQLNEDDHDIDEIESWTAGDFEYAAQVMEDAASAFEDLDPPPAAEQANEEAVKLYGMFSQMFTSMQAAGMWGALPYTESIDQASVDLADAALDFELACEVAFYDHDEDGSAEVGLGTVATPVAGSLAGSRENPIPIGTSADVGDEWQVTVLTVDPNATERVLAESEYNEPPADGRRYFIAEVSVTYVGEDAGTISSYDFAAVGQSSVAYSASEDGCGQFPDELPTREVFAGGTVTGNLCWSIESEDVGSLVMYHRYADQDDRVFLSLVPDS